jgi:hypothetical protein
MVNGFIASSCPSNPIIADDGDSSVVKSLTAPSRSSNPIFDDDDDDDNNDDRGMFSPIPVSSRTG